MPTKPRSNVPRKMTAKQIEKFTQPGWAIEVIGNWDEETQTIIPLDEADKERLKPKPRPRPAGKK